MQEDFSIIPFHGKLVFTEEFLVLLLFDLCHNVLSFLWRETVQNSDFSCLKVSAAESSDTCQPAHSFMHQSLNCNTAGSLISVVNLHRKAHTFISLWISMPLLGRFITTEALTAPYSICFCVIVLLDYLLKMGVQHGNSNHQARRGVWTDVWCRMDWASYLPGSEISEC